MSTPRLRAKLNASTIVASDKDKDENLKGKKGAETTEEDKDVSEGEPEDDAEKDKKDGKKAADKAPVKTGALSPARAGMKAITTGPNASAFPNLAAHLAYDTDLTAEQADAVFEAAMQDVDTSASDEAPKQEASSPKGEALRKAMAAEAPNPKLGAASGGKKTEKGAIPGWLRLLL